MGERTLDHPKLTPIGMSNTSDFILLKEDHTLGNLLSEHLKQAPHVMMAGYKSKAPVALLPLLHTHPVFARLAG